MDVIHKAIVVIILAVVGNLAAVKDVVDVVVTEIVKDVANDNNDLQRLLIKCGYKNFQKWNTKDEFGTSLEDWSDKSYEINGEKIPVSLNLKAFKA